MGVARSTYYYSPQDAKQKEDADLRDRMETLALRFPRYGYRRMTAQLKRGGFHVNHKRVLRIMRESDQGVQYATLLKEHGFRISMSRRGTRMTIR